MPEIKVTISEKIIEYSQMTEDGYFNTIKRIGNAVLHGIERGETEVTIE